MTAPYRELYVEPPRPRASERGRCPWCRARVEWQRGARRVVCGACGALYATAQALVVGDPQKAAVAEPAVALRRVGRDIDLSTAGPVARSVALVVTAFVGLVMLAAVSSGPGVILGCFFTTTALALLVNLVRRTVA